MGSSGAHTFLIHTPTLSLDETCPSSMAYMQLLPLWPLLTDSSSNQISGCLLWTSLSTLSLGTWGRMKSVRTGPCHGLSPNLPGWRPIGYRKGKSDTPPTAHMCTHRQLTPPHFITIDVSRVLHQISSHCAPPPHGHTCPFNRDTPDPGAAASSR